MSKSLKNNTDEELFDLMKSNKNTSRLAFDELYDRYSSKIYSYCRKIMNNSPVADDIYQETFTKFFETAQKGKEMTNVAGYIIRIARNLCLNEKAKKHNDKVALEDYILPSYDKSYGTKQLLDLLDSAIEELPEQYKESLVMKEYMDMSYQEIADNLGITLPIVRIRIYRAKNKLRKVLAPYLNELEKIL